MLYVFDSNFTELVRKCPTDDKREREFLKVILYSVQLLIIITPDYFMI